MSDYSGLFGKKVVVSEESEQSSMPDFLSMLKLPPCLDFPGAVDVRGASQKPELAPEAKRDEWGHLVTGQIYNFQPARRDEGTDPSQEPARDCAPIGTGYGWLAALPLVLFGVVSFFSLALIISFAYFAVTGEMLGGGALSNIR